MDKTFEQNTEFNPDFEEASSYNPKSGFPKADIVAEAVRDCYRKRAVEMMAGAKTTILDKNGNAFPKVLPDTRKVYCSAVEGLIAILRHEITTHKEYSKKLITFQKRKISLKDKYAYSERTYTPIPGDNSSGYKLDPSGNIAYKTNIDPDARKFLPEKSTKLPKPYTDANKRFCIGYYEGLWDAQIDAYWDEMVEIYDKMFAEINVLITAELDNYSQDTATF